MSDNDQIKLFCTEWLLQNECSRGSNCIFLHANMRDITLCDYLDEDEVFVKGSYNQGWQKNVKNRHGGRQRNRNFRNRQNSNRDNNVNHKYSTRNHNVNKQNELNTPSTSSNSSVTSSTASSSTGAYKKILNSEDKKQPPPPAPNMLASNTSESEDENSKNLPNIQHSKNRDWIKSYEFTSRKSKHENDKNSNQSRELKSATKISPTKQEKKDVPVPSASECSEEKVCGICFEVIMQKIPYQRRFGILPNCGHCFCLACIRKWRQAKQFENNIIRACPECRVTSDFVCPSTYWVNTESDKEKLIKNYKNALSKKDCKYFKKGNGSCPFGNKCFYLHALNNGTKVDVGPPPSTRFENLSDEMDLIQKLVLLEYLQNDLLSYSDIEDDEDDDDEDLFEYMFWDSDDDVCFF